MRSGMAWGLVCVLAVAATDSALGAGRGTRTKAPTVVDCGLFSATVPATWQSLKPTEAGVAASFTPAGGAGASRIDIRPLVFLGGRSSPNSTAFRAALGRRFERRGGARARKLSPRPIQSRARVLLDAAYRVAPARGVPSSDVRRRCLFLYEEHVGLDVTCEIHRADGHACATDALALIGSLDCRGRFGARSSFPLGSLPPEAHSRVGEVVQAYAAAAAASPSHAGGLAVGAVCRVRLGKAEFAGRLFRLATVLIDSDGRPRIPRLCVKTTAPWPITERVSLPAHTYLTWTPGRSQVTDPVAKASQRDQSLVERETAARIEAAFERDLAEADRLLTEAQQQLPHSAKVAALAAKRKTLVVIALVNEGDGELNVYLAPGRKPFNLGKAADKAKIVARLNRQRPRWKVTGLKSGKTHKLILPMGQYRAAWGGEAKRSAFGRSGGMSYTSTVVEVRATQTWTFDLKPSAAHGLEWRRTEQGRLPVGGARRIRAGARAPRGAR